MAVHAVDGHDLDLIRSCRPLDDGPRAHLETKQGPAKGGRVAYELAPAVELVGPHDGVAGLLGRIISDADARPQSDLRGREAGVWGRVEQTEKAVEDLNAPLDGTQPPARMGVIVHGGAQKRRAGYIQQLPELLLMAYEACLRDGSSTLRQNAKRRLWGVTLRGKCFRHGLKVGSAWQPGKGPRASWALRDPCLTACTVEACAPKPHLEGRQALWNGPCHKIHLAHQS